MRFKQKIWSFFSDAKLTGQLLAPGVKLVHLEDSYAEQIFLGFIKQQDLTFTKLFGLDLDKETLVEKFGTMDFFATEKRFIIFDVDKLSSQCQNVFLELEDLDPSLYVLLLSKKSSTFVTKLGKKDFVDSFRLEPAAFWETERLLDFLAKRKNFAFDRKTTNFLVNSLEFSLRSYTEFLNTLRTWIPEGTPSFEQSCELLHDKKFDQFHFAKMLSTKKEKSFFKEFKKAGLEVDELRMTLPFMSSHLRKLFSPAYADKKAKLSGYDKEILQGAKKWQSGELIDFMHEISKLDALSKANPESVKHFLDDHIINEKKV